MTANRMKIVVLASALSLLCAAGASAEQRWRAPAPHAHHGISRGHHASHDNRHYGNHHGRHAYRTRHGRLPLLSGQSLGGASRVVSVRRPTASVSGSLTDYGSYGYLDGTTLVYGTAPSADAAFFRPAPKAKIIHVTQEAADGSIRVEDGCSYEKGVCVIRGGN